MRSCLGLAAKQHADSNAIFDLSLFLWLQLPAPTPVDDINTALTPEPQLQA